MKIPQSNGTSNDKHMLKGLSAVLSIIVSIKKSKRHIFIHGNPKVLVTFV